MQECGTYVNCVGYKVQQQQKPPIFKKLDKEACSYKDGTWAHERVRVSRSLKGMGGEYFNLPQNFFTSDP